MYENIIYDSFGCLNAHKGFKIVNHNIRSLLPKINQIRLETDESGVDIYSFCETWLRPEVDSRLLEIPGYSLSRFDRVHPLGSTTIRGGGVCIYVINDVQYRVLQAHCICNPDIEIQAIEIIHEACRNMVIFNVYRPPSGQCQAAMDVLQRTLASITSAARRLDVVIVGDININMLIDSVNRKALLEICDEFNLTSNLQIATRETKTTASSLDVILTSVCHVNCTGIIHNNLSDHYPTFLIKKKIQIKRDKVSFQGRSYRNLDRAAFSDQLTYYNWGRFFATQDVDVAWNEFFKVIQTVSDDMCPIKTFQISNHKPAWYHAELIELAANRDDLFALGKKNHDENILNEARDLRNRVKAGVARSRSDYYINLIETNKANPQKFWNTVKEMLPDSNTNKISTVRLHESDDLCDPSETATIINDFFTSIGPKLDAAIPLASDPCSRRPLVRTLLFEPCISVSMVSDLLAELKPSKPSGCLSISTKLYIIALKTLVEQVTFLFNLSIKTNRVPIAWKRGVVTPIPKKGDRTLLTNIRPISITHICGKILEKLVAASINRHCEDNTIFSDKQMGFRTARSTSTAIFDLISHINIAQNRNHLTGCIFIDYAKAFDCVSHNLLIQKLTDIGIHQDNIGWFRSYFEDRVQAVKANNMLSEFKRVQCGVPQGSVLGPLMFLLFINDMPNLPLQSEIIMYADDVAIYNSGPSLDSVLNILRVDMALIHNWSNFNRLTINFSKSNYMVFGNRSKLRILDIPSSIQVGHNRLSRCHEFNYLGIKLDDELNMGASSNELLKKIHHKVYTLSILRKDLTTVCALRMYKAMILPLIDYPNFCLTPCTEKIKTKIQRLQNKALRICLRSTRMDRTTDIHARARLSTLDKRRDVNILKLVHWKVYSGSANESNNESFRVVTNSQNVSVSTRMRSAPTIRLDTPTSGKVCKSLLFYGASLWNGLTTELRNEPDPHAFKIALKRQFYSTTATNP